MTHIDLSVPPHSQVSPAHVILKKKFTTWKDAREWFDSMGFKTGTSMDWFYNNPNNEYVGVEVELKEVTGTEYTNAVLCFEGKEEEEIDPDDPRDHLRYIKAWAAARITDPLGDPTPWQHHAMVVAACDIIKRYLNEDPRGDHEDRATHIYG